MAKKAKDKPDTCIGPTGPTGPSCGVGPIGPTGPSYGISSQANVFTNQRALAIWSDSLNRLSKAETGDVQEIAAAQMEILSTYYNVGIMHSNRSFKSASIAAGAGLVFFILVIAYSILNPQENVVSIATLGATLSGFISAICFYLYNKSTSQLSGFHEKLYMIQRYLLANSMCEGLNGKDKDETRSAIIKQLANVPMPQHDPIPTPETE
jgi:hypothetical protein